MVVMQLAALLIEVEIAVPRTIDAPAIAVPTIARIKAYSAAEAPLSSFNRFFNSVVMLITPKCYAHRKPISMPDVAGAAGL